MDNESAITEKVEFKDLTQGFLHDMNSLFTITLASISAAKGYDEIPEEAMKHLDDAVAATLKSTELASLLMRSWDNLQLPKKLTKVEEIVQEAVDTVRNTVSSEILFNCNSDVGEKFVFVNRLLIVNLLINLILNAEKAIKEQDINGLISVDYKMINRIVEITIDDNGCAMKRKETELYQKFISDSHNVHGVGLRMIQVIINLHYGYFKIEKNEIGGMSAIVGLPVLASK